MTAFTRHPYRQGLTYLGHWLFAMGIAARLLASVLAFALHAMFPFISIEPRLDLEATSAFLRERNHFIETVDSARSRKNSDLASANVGRSDHPALA